MVQDNQLNIAVFFWYLAKSSLSSVCYCTPGKLLFQETRKTRPFLTGHPVIMSFKMGEWDSLITSNSLNLYIRSSLKLCPHLTQPLVQIAHAHKMMWVTKCFISLHFTELTCTNLCIVLKYKLILIKMQTNKSSSYKNSGCAVIWKSYFREILCRNVHDLKTITYITGSTT